MFSMFVYHLFCVKIWHETTSRRQPMRYVVALAQWIGCLRVWVCSSFVSNKVYSIRAHILSFALTDCKRVDVISFKKWVKVRLQVFFLFLSTYLSITDLAKGCGNVPWLPWIMVIWNCIKVNVPTGRNFYLKIVF